jgi:hypothetical protein
VLVQGGGGVTAQTTRVLTWPIVTVFRFIAHPKTHKLNVTHIAAREYGFDLQYASRPSWSSYAQCLGVFLRRMADWLSTVETLQNLGTKLGATKRLS